MDKRLTPAAAGLLIIPPMLWAGNAVVGRMMAPLVSPMTLNLLRWTLAGLVLLPMAGGILRSGSPLWTQWRWFAWISLFSIGGYNALLYLALNTSTPINVTLVGASTPIWMLLIGRIFYATEITPRQLLGAALSMAGVALVLSRGEWDTLRSLRLVAGDIYILLASMAWAYYSWLIAHPPAATAPVRSHWAPFLLGQIAFGLVWSSAFSAAEWTWTPAHIDWSPAVCAALAFIALGPAVTAYATWGAGVARAGPAIAGFFINLTPLFTALLSSAFLGEAPHLYHGVAFVLIVAGIAFSSRR
ncbi:DMT family transporter [Curvibacter sp. APW13]|uniref:DMT family transporter n=1 Tax=Curvibacter sp. APW13 TaxID=3077236 RepID=UPI0028DE7DAC|nr:DMT family transporter [Curvibacter sp. APW13]MDT8992363.1 DMT family transporter [Curvibacter sp. APW13]